MFNLLNFTFLLSGSNYERDKIIDIRIQRKAAQKLEIKVFEILGRRSMRMYKSNNGFP
jgi:hypothetical protein